MVVPGSALRHRAQRPLEPEALAEELVADAAEPRAAVFRQAVTADDVDLEARIDRVEAPLAPLLDVARALHRAVERVVRHARAIVTDIASVEVPDHDGKALDLLDPPLHRANRRHRAILEQLRVLRCAEMLAAELRDRAAARRALDEAELQQIRLVDVLDRVGLLAERNSERGQADRPAVELHDDRAQELTRLAVEPEGVHLEELERLARDVVRDRTLMAHLRDVAHAPEDAVRHARRPARAAGDLLGRVVCYLDTEDAGRAAGDRRELDRLVVVEPERHAEALAQRSRQQTRARRRADEREGRQVERQRARSRALADDDVETEVFQRRIEDLLDRAVQAVDLVDEEHVSRLERGEDRGDVALALEGGAGDRADADSELLVDDVREARLAEPRRAGEQEMVEGVAASLRRGERDRQLLLHALLPDELVEPARTERLLDLDLFLLDHRCEERAHAALFNAARTRSSAGASGSVSASARSASTTV